MRRPAALAWYAVLLLAVTARGDTAATPADDAPSIPTDCATHSITLYPLPDDPETAIAFTGNPEIFEAVVEASEPARKVTRPGQPVPVLVYVPVRVTVTVVHNGGSVVGQQMVLRDLGGTAPDCTEFLYDQSYPNSTWVPGAEVFVFANEATTDQGWTALTPNWVFVEREGVAVNARAETERMDIDEMRAGVKKRWPRR